MEEISKFLSLTLLPAIVKIHKKMEDKRQKKTFGSKRKLSIAKNVVNLEGIRESSEKDIEQDLEIKPKERKNSHKKRSVLKVPSKIQGKKEEDIMSDEKDPMDKKNWDYLFLKIFLGILLTLQKEKIFLTNGLNIHNPPRCSKFAKSFFSEDGLWSKS
jgi:hypothetical protein